MAGYRLEQFDRRVAAVGDGDQLPLGQPAGEQDQQLARPSFLWRCPRSRAKRSDGASAVTKGKAQTRWAQGIGASSVTVIQRRP